MLFRDMQLSIVEAPPSFNSVREYEGLDACGVLPPLLRPGMLMDLESHHAWERHIVRVLDDDVHTPESALAQLADDAERVRTWRPGDGELMDRIVGLGVSGCAEGSRGPAEAGHYTGSCPQAAHGPAEAGHYAASHTGAQPTARPARSRAPHEIRTQSLHGPVTGTTRDYTRRQPTAGLKPGTMRDYTRRHHTARQTTGTARDQARRDSSTPVVPGFSRASGSTHSDARVSRPLWASSLNLTASTKSTRNSSIPRGWRLAVRSSATWRRRRSDRGSRGTAAAYEPLSLPCGGTERAPRRSGAPVCKGQTCPRPSTAHRGHPAVRPAAGAQSVLADAGRTSNAHGGRHFTDYR